MSAPSDSQKGELACTYASLILHDDGNGITADKIRSLLAAANVEVESYMPALFERCLGSADIGAILAAAASAGGGGGGGAAAAPAAGGGGGGAAKAAEKEPEPEPEPEDEDMGMDLFGF